MYLFSVLMTVVVGLESYISCDRLSFLIGNFTEVLSMRWLLVIDLTLKSQIDVTLTSIFHKDIS